MLHSLLTSWFNFVRDWNYLGVFLLMALESSIVPIPSEVVMPPAAFWASQGKMEFWLVVLAGTAGSYFGSLMSYLVSQWVGRPVVTRFGKYFLLGPEKVAMAEVWVTRYGAGGVFFSRLLPVIRHLVSIPAGLLKMNFVKFSLATTLGAFSWCAILSWFGQQILGDHPELLSSPEAMVAVCREKLHLVVAGVMVLAMAYSVVVYMKRKQPKAATAL
ncbi:MAG: DedA family protein [Deltaproteobacteria bacterium]|nr:DedA family protein [Deltaproteobacteria bacterium]